MYAHYAQGVSYSLCKRRSRSEAGGGVKFRHLQRQYPESVRGIQVFSLALGIGPLAPSLGEASFLVFISFLFCPFLGLFKPIALGVGRMM